MNRNTESHFSRVPYVDHPRSSFDRSSGHTTAFNVGDIIPIYCDEVLPGDTVSMNTTSLVRMQTLLTPVFGNIYLDTYWFFVPNRLTWEHWKEFCGENTQSAWIPQTEYTIPRLKFPTNNSDKTGFPVGSIADYMGINPQTVYSDTDAIQVSALPFRAYGLIWNDFFRDQNLQDPLFVPVSDTQSAYPLSSIQSTADPLPQYGGMPAKAAKFHDYFTSCLPAPQKGPAVMAPISGQIPVVAGSWHGVGTTNPNASGSFRPNNIVFGEVNATSGVLAGVKSSDMSGSSSPFTSILRNNTLTDGFIATNNAFNLYPGNLWAQFSPGSAVGQNYIPNGWPSAAGAGISINDLRLATVVQMYYEALSRGGSRYEEQIQQFFGVSNPDSRIQHPEYLGGRRMQINVHEITNTAQSEQDFLGDVGAQSVTAGSNSDFTKSFTEHGWLIGLAVARYDHSYSQGLARKFTRSSKFDFYNPLFARIGEQPVYNYEIMSSSTNSVGVQSAVFGYQEAWASYRYNPNRVSGRIRPNVPDGFGHWTLDDNYATLPTLSSSWISEDKSNVDRVLAVTSTLNNQIFGDFYFNTKWTRVMPMYSVPGAIGQF